MVSKLGPVAMAWYRMKINAWQDLQSHSIRRSEILGLMPFSQFLNFYLLFGLFIYLLLFLNLFWNFGLVSQSQFFLWIQVDCVQLLTPLTPKGPRAFFSKKHPKSAISRSRSSNEFFNTFLNFQTVGSCPTLLKEHVQNLTTRIVRL
jgi:hypothetical protein